MTQQRKIPRASAPRSAAAKELSKSPTLRFSPTAWAKLLFLRDCGETEVGGFGVVPEDDLLLVKDIQLVRQVCSWAHVAFDDESVADYFDAQVEAGRRPEQFARIWLHTHPGDCPEPSFTDETTFARVFGRADWAVMFILARGGQTYARLRFNIGPGSDVLIPVKVDYSCSFAAADFDAWEDEYQANVHVDASVSRGARRSKHPDLLLDDELTNDWYDSWEEYIEDDDIQEGATA